VNDQKDFERLQQALSTHTNEEWTILLCTRYDEHWCLIGYRDGLFRDFLFSQTADGQLFYHVPEKTIYPLTNTLWRCTTGVKEPLDLVTYVVQYGGETCNEHTSLSTYTSQELHEYLLDEHEPDTDVLITAYYGEREDGEGRYHKHTILDPEIWFMRTLADEDTHVVY